jgi:hypothetical protein
VRATRYLLLTVLLSLPAACGDDDGGSSGEPDCGDGSCSTDTCETSVRCPKDCGACSGTACEVGGPNGSCGEPCESSCDCVNQGEFCTADYGLSPGVCAPVDCITACGTIEDCTYSPGAGGVCEGIGCG